MWKVRLSRTFRLLLWKPNLQLTDRANDEKENEKGKPQCPKTTLETCVSIVHCKRLGQWGDGRRMWMVDARRWEGDGRRTDTDDDDGQLWAA